MEYAVVKIYFGIEYINELAFFEEELQEMNL